MQPGLSLARPAPSSTTASASAGITGPIRFTTSAAAAAKEEKWLSASKVFSQQQPEQSG